MNITSIHNRKNAIIWIRLTDQERNANIEYITKARGLKRRATGRSITKWLNDGLGPQLPVWAKYDY